MGIRNSAKAIILHDGKMLINKIQNSIGDMCYGLPNGAIYYDLPGGGQNQYETLEEAVKRECLEETGYTVAIERLAAIYEEISMHKKFRVDYEPYAHKVLFIFICHLTEEPIKPLTEKDLDMLESEWVRLDDMKIIPLYPRLVHRNLDRLLHAEYPVFLGSEHV